MKYLSCRFIVAGALAGALQGACASEDGAQTTAPNAAGSLSASEAGGGGATGVSEGDGGSSAAASAGVSQAESAGASTSNDGVQIGGGPALVAAGDGSTLSTAGGAPLATGGVGGQSATSTSSAGGGAPLVATDSQGGEGGEGGQSSSAASDGGSGADADSAGAASLPDMPATGGAAVASGGASTVDDDVMREAAVECGVGEFDAEVTLDGETWQASYHGDGVYTGRSMLDAMQSAVDSLSRGRSTLEKVVVRDSGSIDAGASVNLPSYTSFESCGTIDVTGAPGGDQAVVKGRGVTDVKVPHLKITGGPYFGVFFRESHNIHLGQIDLRLSGGLGIRIDNNPPQNGWGTINRSTNIRMDWVYVEGTNNHGVETYGVDGLVIGTVIARDTQNAGLLLNATINAEIGLVDAIGAARGEDGSGNGYAAFRMANQNGRLSNFDTWDSVNLDVDYAPNIYVKEVRAQGGGRGIFCVSGSGGAVIDRIELKGVGTRPVIFIEDCYNVAIGAAGGVVDRAGASHDHDITITARSSSSSDATFLYYSAGIVIENLELIDSPISESACNQSGNPGSNIVRNNTMSGGSLNVCAGTDQGNN